MTQAARMPSLAEIREASAEVDSHGYVLLTLARPFGPVMAWGALRLGLAARHVTYVAFLFGVVLLWFAAFGGRTGTWLAPTLIIAWEVLDVTDGSMARVLRKRDNFGGFVDYAAGVALIAFFPVALAIGCARNADGSGTRLLETVGIAGQMDGVSIVACGAAIAAIATYMRVLNRTLEVRFGSAVAGDGERRGRGLVAIVRLVIRNLETIGGVQAFVLAAAAATRRLEVALMLYVPFYTGLLIAFLVTVFRNYSSRTAYLPPPEGR